MHKAIFRPVRLVAAAGLSVLAGCVSPAPDIKLGAVTVVNADSQGDLAHALEARKFSIGGIGFVPDRAMPTGPLLLTHFTSQTDLARLPYNASLQVDSFFCDRPQAHVMLGAGDAILSAGRDVADGPAPDAAANPAGPFDYAIFFHVARQTNPRLIPPDVGFDFRAAPEDICFALVGGPNRDLGYRSNELRIAADTISAAIRNYDAQAARPVSP